ncbi:MAG: alginate lyase family protein [Pseudomonadota bacterium]|nr:alginate lyase family protein [Pseudomonadota bacterium]
MGNHLFANAKALLFAGSFFDGNEAKIWWETGHKLIGKELAEQLLADGGNFELSTMYHMIFLEDLLDITNIYCAYGDSAPDEFEDSISSMYHWLAVMCHPDGEISFFNDAALGITPSVIEVHEYGERLLGIDKPALSNDEFSELCFVELPATGYSRVQMRAMVAIIDRAAIGPDYLPGHAHADTLSFELSLFGQRVVVNSGTSVYGSDADRQQERSTAAHSTVVIDDQDSSEVWSSFRVARRARVFDCCAMQLEGVVRLSACHDGYKRLPGEPVHCREWLFEEGLLTMTDKVTGTGVHQVESVLPLHPKVKIKVLEGGQATLEVGGSSVVIIVDGNGELNEVKSSYHPEFGLSVENRQLVYYSSGALPIKIITRIHW